MDVEVLFFGKPRELAGALQETVSLETGGRLADLFDSLGRKHGQLLAQELASPEKLIVMVNGRHFTSLDGVRTRLNDGDTVAVLPIAVGG